MRDSNPHKRGAAEVNNAEMDRRVKAIAERSRREGHTGEVTRRFVDPATLPPSKVMAFKEKVCALPSCAERFVPTGPRQKYHTKKCANTAKQAAKGEARRARAADRLRARAADKPAEPTELAETVEDEGLSSDHSPEVEPSSPAPGAMAAELDEAERRLRAEHPPQGDGSLRDRYTELLFAIVEDARERQHTPPSSVLDRLERLVDAP